MIIKTKENERRKVIISRTLLSDGYNYYLMLITKNNFNGAEFINERYKQKDCITSLKEAERRASELLSQGVN